MGGAIFSVGAAMVGNGDGSAGAPLPGGPEPSAAERRSLPPAKSDPTAPGEGLFARIRTGEWPVVRIDLSEAYANVRRRAETLRRRRIISSILAGAVLASLATVLGVYYVSSVPLPDALRLPATTTVYYSDGTTVMARLGSQRRILVRGDTLPPYVGHAVVAAEDPSFWLDSGTLISRQYARAATSVSGDSGTAQARLLVMAWKLEDTYSKEQILDFYLNTVYFGRGSYGVEAAARAYFSTHAADLTMAQAVVLAGVIASPGDGRYDPSVDAVAAQARFSTVVDQMRAIGAIDAPTAQQLRMPRVDPYDATQLQSALDQPTGLVVSHVLAELRATEPLHGNPPGYIEDGGFAIVTTVDARAQRVLEQAADETVPGSLMHGQPRNLQAAAVVIEPGTGRVLAYFGGHDGTGADYAGTYRSANGKIAGFGAHPPGQTMDAFTLIAALDRGIAVRSRWDSPSVKEFPASGRTGENQVRDVVDAPCQPRCTLAEAATAGLTIPYFAVAERVGAAAVIDKARAVGIGEMWLPATADKAAQRFDLTGASGSALTPAPFGTDAALGTYPVTVLDEANAMATFAAGGRRSTAHFVRQVTKDFHTVYAEPSRESGPPAINKATVDDVTWVLAQNPAGALPGGRPSAVLAGVGRLRTSALDNAHAWLVGYTANLAVAVWIGNQETEFPLRDKLGDRVTGSGLPAEIYRTVVDGVSDRLGLPVVGFATPSFTGDPGAGDAA